MPLLSLCYGAQLIAHNLGAEVIPSKSREYGRSKIITVSQKGLFKDVGNNSQVWMSHGDTINDLPSGCKLLCKYK